MAKHTNSHTLNSTLLSHEMRSSCSGDTVTKLSERIEGISICLEKAHLLIQGHWYWKLCWPKTNCNGFNLQRLEEKPQISSVRSHLLPLYVTYSWFHLGSVHQRLQSNSGHCCISCKQIQFGTRSRAVGGLWTSALIVHNMRNFY